MIQVGIRLHDVNTTVGKEFQTLEERAKTAHERGFKCVHLALSKNGYPNDPCALNEGLGYHVKRVFEENKLDIAVLGCYLNLLHPDPNERKKIKEKYYANLRIARIMGAGMVGTETGCPNAEYHYTLANLKQETLSEFIYSLQDVTEKAEEMGVSIAIEPVTKHSVFNADRALQVIKDLRSPSLRIIFDPVNLLSIDNYEKRDYVLEDAMDKLADYIAMVHIKDFTVENGDLKACAAGEGLMNYEPILKFLKAKKPWIQATLENTNDNNSVKSRELIERLYNEI